ncbi:MAG: tRNA (adenosine(37)-N6)-threonylcarbamoyltransferase complex dimerization subunit type 1 TsaB [Chthoniobacterales bacterium]
MHILAIENSTSTGSIALWCNGEVLFEESFIGRRGQGSLLFETLQRCLKKKQGGLDRIAIGTGPGSYNGIRIALAAGKGIQLVEECGFVALSSSLCLAVDSPEYIWFGDARAGQFHFSRISNRAFQDAPRLVTPEELSLLLSKAGCPAFSDITHEGLGADYQVVAPSAKILAELSVDSPLEKNMPEPIYLKPPHITISRNPQSCIPTRSG